MEPEPRVRGTCRRASAFQAEDRGGLFDGAEQLPGLCGEAGQDGVDAAQASLVDEGLLVGDPLPACGQYGVGTLASADGDSPGGVSQMPAGRMRGSCIPRRQAVLEDEELTGVCASTVAALALGVSHPAMRQDDPAGGM